MLNIHTLRTPVDRNLNVAGAYQTFQWGPSFHKTFLRFLRVSYVVSPHQAAPPSYQQRQINAKLFTPALIQDPTWRKQAKFEPQTTSKERMNEWLTKTRVKVMAVETVIYKTRSGAEGREGLDAMLSWNETHHNTQTHSEEPVFEQYITCYRAYYEGPSVQDPPKFQWPRSIEDYIREHANDTCSIM